VRNQAQKGMASGIFIGFPPGALTLLNGPAVVAIIFSGLRLMWASVSGWEEARSQFRA
jgi:hypothetical protein